MKTTDGRRLFGTTFSPPPLRYSIPTGYLDVLLFSSSSTCTGEPDTETTRASGLCIPTLNIVGQPISSSVLTIEFPTKLIGFAEQVVSSFADTQCQSANASSRVVTTVPINKCVAITGGGSTLTTWQSGVTKPNWQIYGYSILSYTSPVACASGSYLLTQTIYNRLSCSPEKDANNVATGVYVETQCNTLNLYTTTFSDPACTKATKVPRTTTPIPESCNGASRPFCVQQVPTTQPTTRPPSQTPTPKPSPSPSQRPTSPPSSFPTITSLSRTVFYAGTNATIAGAYAIYTTIPGLVASTTWFLTVDVLGTGFTSPDLQAQPQSRVTISTVVKTGDGRESILSAACLPNPQRLCDVSDSGYTNCITNLDVTPFVTSGSLHLSSFSQGSALPEGVCKKSGLYSLYMRYTLSGTNPNPTLAPSILPPSLLASATLAAAAPVRDVFIDFQAHTFIAFIFFAAYLTFGMALLRVKRGRVRAALSSSAAAQLPSFFQLGSCSIALHVLLFASSFVMEGFLASFLLIVGGSKFDAVGAVILVARLVVMIPNAFTISMIFEKPSSSASSVKTTGSGSAANNLSTKEMKRHPGLFNLVAAVSVVDVTFIRLLPWRRNTWTDRTDGYPTYFLMRFAIFSKIAQGIVIIGLESFFLALCEGTSVTTATTLTTTALALTTGTVLHCFGSLFLLLEEAQRLKRKRQLKLDELAKPSISFQDVHGDGDGGDAVSLNPMLFVTTQSSKASVTIADTNCVEVPEILSPSSAAPTSIPTSDLQSPERAGIELGEEAS